MSSSSQIYTPDYNSVTFVVKTSILLLQQKSKSRQRYHCDIDCHHLRLLLSQNRELETMALSSGKKDGGVSGLNTSLSLFLLHAMS